MVSVILNGGLGNQMFQFATAKALALKLGTELELDLSFFNLHGNKPWCRSYELEIFKHHARVKKVTFSLNKYIIYIVPTLKKNNVGKWILSKLKFYFDDDYQSKRFLSLRNGTTFYGTFPNENFFIQYRNEILTEFLFKDPLDSVCQQVSNEILKSNSVSIHIRRGDYLNSKNSSIYYQCSLDWYNTAIQYLKERVDAPVFYFFSDDMDWVKENFKSTENSYFVDFNKGTTAYNDMRLMSLCKHNIIANSTFSWWGAWLNQYPGKIVIAPKNYYKKENKNKEKPNIMPESWILL
jgi:hypothetical protein